MTISEYARIAATRINQLAADDIGRIFGTKCKEEVAQIVQSAIDAATAELRAEVERLRELLRVDNSTVIAAVEHISEGATGVLMQEVGKLRAKNAAPWRPKPGSCSTAWSALRVGT